MSRRNLRASILAACVLLAGGIGGLAPAASAAPVGSSLANPSEGAGDSVIQVKRRGHHGHGHGHGYRYRPRVYIRPIAPSYLYYDYPYYAGRGYYPSHIGPGFIYHYPVEYEDDESYVEEVSVPYSAKQRCERRFKSFDWDSGLYTTYGGKKKICPYLR